MSEFVAQVKAAMKARGTTQAQLAEQCGYTQGHVSKLLRQKQLQGPARKKLERWLAREPRLPRRVHTIEPAEIVRLGHLLKRKCDELARLQRQLAEVSVRETQ